VDPIDPVRYSLHCAQLRAERVPKSGTDRTGNIPGVVAKIYNVMGCTFAILSKIIVAQGHSWFSYSQPHYTWFRVTASIARISDDAGLSDMDSTTSAA
jgi:hypothetical protein